MPTLAPPLLSIAAALALLGFTPFVAQAQPRTPPAPQCMDSREVREVFQSDDRTLAMLQTDGRRFRVELEADCANATLASNARLLAANGWMCGTGNEFVALDDRTCRVNRVEPITSAEYAGHARASQTSADGATTLATVVVKGERRRGFAASHSYCFNPRYMRGWSEDAEGLLVEVNPRRSGGNRYYRVELVQSCPQLAGPVEISMRSGVGIGLVCGNAGDSILVTTDGITGRHPGFTMTGSERLRILGARLGCPIRAVYPADSG